MDQHPAPDDAAGPRTLEPRTVPPRPRFRPQWAALPLAAAGLAIAVSVLPPGSTGAPPASTGSVPTVTTPSVTAGPETVPPTAPPAVAPPAAPPAAAAADPGPAASPPTALSFPAAGIDMSVLPLTPTESDLATQTLVPPLTADAYWLTSYGVPGAGSDNTTYIAGHSWEGREAPFNNLSDETLVGTGFTLTTATGDIDYVVDGVVTHDKDTLKDSEIWNIVPGRVVLISCYTEDPWGRNVVVTAMPKAA